MELRQALVGWPNARQEDVGHVLVLAQQRQMQQDLDRLRVGRQDDELGDAAVERLQTTHQHACESAGVRKTDLGDLVGALLELLVVRRLLDDLEDLVRELQGRQQALEGAQSRRTAASASGKAFGLTSAVMMGGADCVDVSY